MEQEVAAARARLACLSQGLLSAIGKEFLELHDELTYLQAGIELVQAYVSELRRLVSSSTLEAWRAAADYYDAEMNVPFS